MAEDTINWGVLGAAEIACEHTIPAMIAADNSRPYAIASRRGVPHDLIQRYGFETGYSDYQSLLADPDVDAIYIPLPNDQHAKWTIKAAQAGKHVLCEKPASLNTNQLCEAIAVCETARVWFMEAMMYQFHAQHARVRELIDAGVIGDIRGAHVSLTFNLDKSASDFRRQGLEHGGGSLYDLGCYCVHIIRQLLGEPDRVATTARWASNREAEMSAAAILGYEYGAKASFDCGMDAVGRHTYEIYGTDGTICVPKAFVPQADGHGLIEIMHRDGRMSYEDTTSFQYPNGVAHFADCVLYGHPPDYSPSNVLANMRVLDACIASATTHDMIQLENSR